ncbi:hypothetical protein B4089_3849 [Bacillus licheniformis]|nr:hypothetical protein B4089_3849 [Bacillus licheniformis]TWM57491.1 hypothetical protein CHCC14815_3681 [Bacillus licheniformis]
MHLLETYKNTSATYIFYKERTSPKACGRSCKNSEINVPRNSVKSIAISF